MAPAFTMGLWGFSVRVRNNVAFALNNKFKCYHFNSKMKKATKMGKRIAAILDNKTGLTIML